MTKQNLGKTMKKHTPVDCPICGVFGCTECMPITPPDTQREEKGLEEKINDIICVNAGVDTDFLVEDLLKLFQSQRQQLLKEVGERARELFKPEWNDKDMESKKFNYRRRIGYRDMLRKEIDQSLTALLSSMEGKL